MKPKSVFSRLISLVLLASTLVVPGFAQAASGQLTNRSVTLTNSAGATAPQTATYTATFTLATAGQTLGSIKLEICDSPLSSVACVNSGNSNGATFTGAGFGSVNCSVSACNGGSWSLGSASGNSAYVTHASAAVTGTPTVTVAINTVTNPNANNKQFYVRISTYSAADTSAPAYPGTDYGAVAVSTAQQVTVSGTMPESLVFCVGTVWTSSCSDISGSAVDLGTFSPTATNKGTSVMSASTNAGTGYAITVNGTTMTSGAATIPAMGTQSLNSAACAPSCTSTTGTSQYGSNIRANNIASAGGAFGADVSGTGTAAGVGGYNTTNVFRFFSGDTVAAVGGPTNNNLFTNSYIVNVGGSQAAGLYTSTMTYICTATF
jgi:hypothetical protein